MDNILVGYGFGCFEWLKKERIAFLEPIFIVILLSSRRKQSFSGGVECVLHLWCCFWFVDVVKAEIELKPEILSVSFKQIHKWRQQPAPTLGWDVSMSKNERREKSEFFSLRAWWTFVCGMEKGRKKFQVTYLHNSTKVLDIISTNR